MELSKLKDPFPANDIEWRLQSAGEKNGKFWGKCLAYVTNRAIMNRLDEVCGPENWKNEFATAPDGGVLCGISIKIGDEWVTKYDGAENTDIEGVKGGLSGSMKRAAVQWGIGRYLYNLDEGWADIREDGKFTGKTKDGKFFKWNQPALPAWALPEGAKEEPKQTKTAPVKADTEELKKLKICLQDWVASGAIPESWQSKVDYYLANDDVEGIRNVIKWCKENKDN